MQIKMLKTSIGSATALGNITMDYVEGETYTMMEDWQKIIANTFIQQGWAKELGGTKQTKVDTPTEVKKIEETSTKDVNEEPKKTTKKTK